MTRCYLCCGRIEGGDQVVALWILMDEHLIVPAGTEGAKRLVICWPCVTGIAQRSKGRARPG